MGAVAAFLLSPVGRALMIVIAVLGALWGFHLYAENRYASGRADERVEWETAAKVERERQAAIRLAIEKLGEKISADITQKVADLQPVLKDLADDTAQEAAQPIPTPAPGCPDLYRGLGADSLRKLEAIR